MKIRVLLAFVLVVISQLSFAGKIAVFNLQAAIVESNEYKTARSEFDSHKEIVTIVARLESLKEEIKKMLKEEETKGLTWSVEERTAHRKEVSKLNNEYQSISQNYQAAIVAMEKSVMAKVQPKLSAALKEVVAEESIDIVLQQQAAVWAKPDLNITEKLTKKLNSQK